MSVMRKEQRRVPHSGSSDGKGGGEKAVDRSRRSVKTKDSEHLSRDVRCERFRIMLSSTNLRRIQGQHVHPLLD